MELKKIKNNIVIRIFFIITIYLSSDYLTFRFANFFGINNWYIIFLLSYISLFFIFFIFKQLDFRSLFKRTKLPKEIFFWKLIYMYSSVFISSVLLKVFPYFFSVLKKHNSYVLGDKKNLTLIFIVLIGPLCEEIFFRGIVFKVFKNNSKLTIVVLSGILFVLDHGKVGIPILISGSSFYYGYVYMKTESLWSTTIIHVINNGLAVFLILTKSQLLIEGPLYYPLGLSSVIISFYGFSKMYKFLKSQS